MISFISSLEVTNVVASDTNIFLLIAASVVDAAAVNPNEIKTLSASCLGKFSIKGNPVFSNGPKSLPKNPCPVLCNWIFDNFISANEPVAKALESFEFCVLVSNNLCRKLFSSLELPTTFDESFKVTSVPSFIPNFNLLSCELDNFMLRVLHSVILYWYYIKTKWYYNTFPVPCEKSKMVTLASPVIENITLLSAPLRFPAKLVFYIAFR